jgi:ribosomal protein S18 acetylase RimI-like enzyme
MTIPQYRASDEEPVVELSLRAWAPVFASLEQALGNELLTRLHGDWREYQAGAVRDTLADDATEVWVAVTEQRVVGFVAAILHRERSIGEIWMLAVDPADQSRGVGAALTDFATDWLGSSGMQVAMIDTGGDPGHAPARRLYEKAEYTPLSVVRYFKPL